MHVMSKIEMIQGSNLNHEMKYFYFKRDMEYANGVMGFELLVPSE